MSEYQWALGNGEIVTADYNRANDHVSNNQVFEELLNAFQQFGHSVTCEVVSNQLSEVYTISFEDSSYERITVCAKGTTPGGRSNLNDEQRTQQKSKYINYAYQQLQSGHVAVQLGVYRRDGQTIFCAWKLKQSSADSETPISKQIKVTTIAQAMKEGFVQQEKGSGEYACAFRKEFIYFYIRNAKWLHGSLVTELSDYCRPLPNIDNESAFKDWFANYRRSNGEPYSPNTQSQYLSAMRIAATEFADVIAPHSKFFTIKTVDELELIRSTLEQDSRYGEFNRSRGSGELPACLSLYKQFLEESATKDCSTTGYISKFSRNRILFGAPGTGKSFTLNGDRKELLYGDRKVDENTIDRSLYGEYERVTFHPDYSYANFVGTYKPVPCKDSDGKDAITYSYLPGPFMRTYVKALQNSKTENIKPFLLVIEEINRANVAAVFGDIFQLLDRGDNGVSEYPIQASEDIKKYLADKLDGNPDEFSKIRIPDNMFIWATMNSADQGVFPMDTAFKRRWDFTYLGIDENDEDIRDKYVLLGKEANQKVEWNELRKAINNFLANCKINEDKQLGPYFLSRSLIAPENGDEINREKFIETFKNKVIMYLFEDAAKQKRASLFAGCGTAHNRYSQICKLFEEKGIEIFNDEIISATNYERISD